MHLSSLPYKKGLVDSFLVMKIALVCFNGQTYISPANARLGLDEYFADCFSNSSNTSRESLRITMV